jgi:hypothetical protein
LLTEVSNHQHIRDDRPEIIPLPPVLLKGIATAGSQEDNNRIYFIPNKKLLVVWTTKCSYQISFMSCSNIFFVDGHGNYNNCKHTIMIKLDMTQLVLWKLEYSGEQVLRQDGAATNSNKK